MPDFNALSQELISRLDKRDTEGVKDVFRSVPGMVRDEQEIEEYGRILIGYKAEHKMDEASLHNFAEWLDLVNQLGPLEPKDVIKVTIRAAIDAPVRKALLAALATL